MNFDLQAILESKRVFRRNFIGRTVGEKLRMLDAMRERTLAIRRAPLKVESGALREALAPYRTDVESE
jgi:hypothetical protein